MSISDKDRRALLFLGIAVVLFLLLQTDLLFPSADTAASASASIEAEENKIQRTTARIWGEGEPSTSEG